MKQLLRMPVIVLTGLAIVIISATANGLSISFMENAPESAGNWGFAMVIAVGLTGLLFASASLLHRVKLSAFSKSLLVLASAAAAIYISANSYIALYQSLTPGSMIKTYEAIAQLKSGDEYAYIACLLSIFSVALVYVLTAFLHKLNWHETSAESPSGTKKLKLSFRGLAFYTELFLLVWIVYLAARQFLNPDIDQQALMTLMGSIAAVIVVIETKLDN